MVFRGNWTSWWRLVLVWGLVVGALPLPLDDTVGGSDVEAAAAAAIAAEVPWYYHIVSWQTIGGLILMSSPLTSYGDTVYTIWKTKSSAGFSLDLCGIMLVSSILRVAFYFGEPYEASLLWQALIMIAIQVVLLSLALQYRAPNVVYTKGDEFFTQPIGGGGTAGVPGAGGSSNRGNSLLDVDPAKAQLSMAPKTDPRRHSLSEVVHNLRPARSVSVLRTVAELPDVAASSVPAAQGFASRIVPLARKVSRMIRTTTATSSGSLLAYTPPGYGSRPMNLWQWNSDEVYWQFLLLLCAVLFVLHLVLGTWCWAYIQLLGLVGLMIEAVLPVPQILTNAQLESVQGFRLSLMASWLAGDVSKLTYFRYGTENLAPQFVVCTVVRLALDLFVGVQYVFYAMILPSLKSMSSSPVPGTGSNGGSRTGEVIELRPVMMNKELHLTPQSVLSEPPSPPLEKPTTTRQRSHSIKQLVTNIA